MLTLAGLVSLSTLAVTVLASEDGQTPLHTPLPRHHYVDCENDIWSGRILDCGQLDVPLDWQNPIVGSVTLNYTALPVKRRTPRKGTVFLHLGHEYLGRTSQPENALNVMFSEGKQLEKIASEYDLVMWTSRDSAVSRSTKCFADNEERFTFSPNPYAQLNNATMAFYNTTFRDDLHRELPWDGELAWLDTPGPEDIKDMLTAQEKMITQCLQASPNHGSLMYAGTAASVRDLIALADALDGPGSPINLWTKHHGSILASHLLAMFPERVGKVVMDDPVDPIGYQEQPTHLRWAEDIATANNTLARIQQQDMRNGSTGYMEFIGHPNTDEIRLGQITQFLHLELVEWHTRGDADHQVTLRKKERERWMDPEDLDFRMILNFPRQTTGVNGWRSGTWSAQVLNGMPLVCGDFLHEYDHDMVALREQVEESLIDHMNSAPLIGTSVFPPLRYLCSLWPIRAVERIPLRRADSDMRDLSDKVLILLRDSDYWNYFSVSENLANERWPTANVVGGLHYGDLALDHDQCSYDIIKAFYGSGELPGGSRPCRYDDEDGLSREQKFPGMYQPWKLIHV